LPKENINIKWSKPITNVLFMCKCVLPLGVNPTAADKYINIKNEDLWNTIIHISTVEQMKRSKCKWIGCTLKTPQEATKDCSGLVSPR
jgi:hypothetical protein